MTPAFGFGSPTSSSGAPSRLVSQCNNTSNMVYLLSTIVNDHDADIRLRFHDIVLGRSEQVGEPVQQHIEHGLPPWASTTNGIVGHGFFPFCPRMGNSTNSRARPTGLVLPRLSIYPGLVSLILAFRQPPRVAASAGFTDTRPGNFPSPMRRSETACPGDAMSPGFFSFRHDPSRHDAEQTCRENL